MILALSCSALVSTGHISINPISERFTVSSASSGLSEKRTAETVSDMTDARMALSSLESGLNISTASLSLPSRLLFMKSPASIALTFASRFPVSTILWDLGTTRLYSPLSAARASSDGDTSSPNAPRAEKMPPWLPAPSTISPFATMFESMYEYPIPFASKISRPCFFLNSFSFLNSAAPSGDPVGTS